MTLKDIAIFATFAIFAVPAVFVVWLAVEIVSWARPDSVTYTIHTVTPRDLK